MDYIGFLGAFFMGISLGFIGAGGSILSVPIFVYLFSVPPLLATTYALVIVGLSSFVGASSFMRKKRVVFSLALVFSIPSTFSVFSIRKFLLHKLPENIDFFYFNFERRSLIMTAFATIMLLASYSMIFGRKDREERGEANKLALFLSALAIGALSGFVGAGGGFLILPSLVYLGALPMQYAVGTSLLIISIQSTCGVLLSDQSILLGADWNLLGKFISCSLSGILLGSSLSRAIAGQKLKALFGVFVFFMGLATLIKEAGLLDFLSKS